VVDCMLCSALDYCIAHILTLDYSIQHDNN
jgi:hypothetical protein